MKLKALMKLTVATIIVVFTLGGAVKAQTATIRGSVIDEKTGEAMPFVNVGLMRVADTVFVRGSATGPDGIFEIRTVTPGDYLLQASFVGYGTTVRPITVDRDINDIKVEMRTVGKRLDEVEIVAEKPLYLMDGEKNMYNTKEDPSIQTGTASDALQNAPGVEVDAEGNITLRGVSSVEIWINDQPSHMNEEALKQYIKTMPANAIERIEVITNPSARYSTSGGVINIVTNQKITRNELLCLGVRATTMPNVSPWVSYVWANEKVDFNFYLNGSYSRHDGASEGTTTLLDDTGAVSRRQHFNTESKMPFWGGYAGFNMNWKIDSTRNLAAWVGAYPYWDRNSYNHDYEYLEYAGGTPVDLGYYDTVRNNGFSHGAYGGAWYEHRYDTTGRKVSVNFNGNYWSNGGYSDNWRNYKPATLTDYTRHMEGDMFNGSGELGVNYTRPLKHDITIEAGAELNAAYEDGNEVRDSLLPSGDWSNMAYRSYMTQCTTIEPAAYVTAQKRWGGFTTKLGLRYDYNMKSGLAEHPSQGDRQRLDTAFHGLIPSLHLSYQTKTFENYSLSYTRRFTHSGSLTDYMPFCIYDDYSLSTGNPNLLMSYTHNLEAAFNKYVMGFGNIGVNAYFRANENEIGSMSSDTIVPGIYAYRVDYSYPVNIGSSHTEGIEANITYRPTGFFNVRFNASLFNYGYRYNYNGTEYADNGLSYSFRLNVWAKVWNKVELFANGRYSSPRLGLFSLSKPNYSVDFGASSDFFDRKLSVYLNVRDVFGWSEWGSETTAPQYQTDISNRFKTTFVSLGLTWRIGKMELESKARQGATDAGNTPQM